MKNILVILALLLPLVLMPVHAADANDAPYNAVGVIDVVNTKSRAIIISDIPFRLGNNLMIRDSNGKLLNLDRLKPGQIVGTRTGQSADRTLYELWLLPDDFDIERFYADGDNQAR